MCRESGAVEVLTPCKLRKYRNLVTQFETTHPLKLAPISAFSPAFAHVSHDEDKHNTVGPGPATKGATDSSSGAKAPPAAPTTTYISATPFYHAYYTPPMAIPSSYPIIPTSPSPSASSGLQWISAPFPGPNARTPEKYHSFHPYTPPTPPK